MKPLLRTPASTFILLLLPAVSAVSTLTGAADPVSAPQVMQLEYRSAFGRADDSAASNDAAAVQPEMNAPDMTPDSPLPMAPDADAKSMPMNSPKTGNEAPSSDESMMQDATMPAPDSEPQQLGLPFDSAFDDFRSWDEPADSPSWGEANRAAAEAGGWQAYATELYRANKAAREAAAEAGADQ